MFDFVNAPSMKFAVLLGGVTLVASVYCEEDVLAEQNELLDSVLTLDTPRQAIAYVSAALGVAVPAVFYKKYSDRIPDPTPLVFFGAVAVLVVVAVGSFVGHLYAGRVHAMYLSSLILCLGPALTSLSLPVMSWLLSKYGPPEYAEIIFKNGNPELPPPSPFEQSSAVTTAITSLKNTYDTAVKAALAAAQQGQAQQGQLKLDEASEQNITAEVTKLMDLLEGDNVPIADCDAIRAAIDVISQSSGITGSEPFCKFLKTVLSECIKIRQKLGSKYVKDSFKYLQSLDLPPKADMPKLKALAGHLDNLLNNMPSGEEKPYGQNAQGPAMEMEMGMEEEEMMNERVMRKEPLPVKEKPVSKAGSPATPSAEKEISFTRGSCTELLRKVYEKIAVHVTKVYGGQENAELNKLDEESVVFLYGFIHPVEQYASFFLQHTEGMYAKFDRLKERVYARILEFKNKREPEGGQGERDFERREDGEDEDEEAGQGEREGEDGPEGVQGRSDYVKNLLKRVRASSNKNQGQNYSTNEEGPRQVHLQPPQFSTGSSATTTSTFTRTFTSHEDDDQIF